MVKNQRQETSVNVTQLRQPAAKDLPTSDIVQQQATIVKQASVASDLPILDEVSIVTEQAHRPDTPQVVQYKAPADIQPSTGTLLRSTSALSEEEPAQEPSTHVNQLRQPAAKELPDETKQFTQVPTDMKEVSATLLRTPSVLATEDDLDELIPTTAQGYQQQQGYKMQRTSVVSDFSYASAEDEFAELSHEVKVQQQRLLKMPPKLRDQPKLIETRLSIVESDDHAQSTTLSHRRQMVAAVKKLEEKERSISPESSMNIEEVIETIRLEDELIEPKRAFVADIAAPTEETALLSSAEATVDVLPSISELPQTNSEEITAQLDQWETVSSDQRVEEFLPAVNPEIQSLLHQLEQVSSIKPAPLDLPTADEAQSFVFVEKESPSPIPSTTEESFEIISNKVVDYIEILPSKTVSNETIPEAIIVTQEDQPAESEERVEGMFFFNKRSNN